MLTILFILTCIFSNGLFYDWRYIRSLPMLVLSPSLSLCLSAILPFAPFSISDIKDHLIVCKIINWINAFDYAAVLISKGNIIQNIQFLMNPMTPR